MNEAPYCDTWTQIEQHLRRKIEPQFSEKDMDKLVHNYVLAVKFISQMDQSIRMFSLKLPEWFRSHWESNLEETKHEAFKIDLPENFWATWKKVEDEFKRMNNFE